MIVAQYSERFLTLSAVLGLTHLRRYLSDHPEVDTKTAIKSVQLTDSQAQGLDYETACLLHELIGSDIDISLTLVGLRTTIFELVKTVEPSWLRIVPYGREHLRAALTQDEAQCFREAGLFDAVPSDDIVSWWDQVGALMRGRIHAEQMERAREAERLSLEFERARLSTLGLSIEPKWVSLEDNQAGYDILSYDRDEDQIRPRLIEVKSTKSSRIILTRGEWKNAVSTGDQYSFHVWQFPGRSLQEFSVASVGDSIPVDRDAGLWETASIDVDGLKKLD